MHTLIVIPTYNEVENISLLIKDINKTVNNHDFSILVVDDNSTDGTIDVLNKLKEEYSNLYLLNRQAKLGLASAYIEGFKYGIELGFDSFIQMDADFSHNPKYLNMMFQKLLDDDVVIASRNIPGGKVEGWGFLRKTISKGGSLYSNIVLNCPIKDLTGGFNGWRKEILEKIGLDNIISKGYCFQVEMKYRAFKKGARMVEFPITFIDRCKGKSKMSNSIFLEAFFNILKLRFIYKV